MFRFSRDKRLLQRVSLSDFIRASRSLVQVVQAERPGARAVVLTCEDPVTHAYSQVTFGSDEVENALQGRRDYLPDQLTKDVWDRSLNIQLTIKDPSDSEPFMICMSCDKQSDGGRIKFYGQCISEYLSDLIHEIFARPTLRFSIGNGYSKPSAFNLKVGERITGISLS